MFDPAGEAVKRLAAFYHLYADGDWRRIAQEYFDALERVEWPGDVFLGVVWPDEGWENETLDELHDYCQRNPDAYVMYAHTKGVTQPGEYADRWRRSMTAKVVGEWREWIPLLEGHDAVGCHWLTHAEFPQFKDELADGFFAGNFWAARADYIAGLPRCLRNDRWDAERWIGLGSPRVYDLLPGYPSMDVFA